MPYKEPPKQHQFKPGQSGNPSGKPKGAGVIPEPTKKSIKKRFEDFIEYMNKYWDMPLNETGKVVLKGKEEVSTFEYMCAKLALDSATGDLNKVEFLFDVIYGKKRPEVSVANTFNFDTLTPEQKLLLARRITNQLEAQVNKTDIIEAKVE